MKTTSALLLLITGTLYAQNTTDTVHVPLSDPSRPARIHAHVMVGSIIVRGTSNSKEVVVETKPSSGRYRERDRDRDRDMPEPPTPPTPPAPAGTQGMHRLYGPGGRGLDIVEDNNLVNIKASPWSHGDMTITVPRHASLELRTLGGGTISVEDVDGEIDANGLAGSVDLKNVGGSVVVHSLNGEIKVTLDRVDPSKPMSFSTMNGNIDVTLPGNVRANVRMKTDNGEIYSDFDVKLDGETHISSDTDRSGTAHHYRIDRIIRGTINGGGPEYQFTSFNGNIMIRKKK
jgi:hypothetical protein